MERELKINVQCIIKAIWTKLLGALLVSIYATTMDFSLPKEGFDIFVYFSVIILLVFGAWIWPFMFFINYYLNDIHVSLIINYDTGIISIFDTGIKTIVLNQDIVKITIHKNPRALFKFLGYYYYSIETTNRIYHFSMFTSSSLESHFPNVPFEIADEYLPFIKS